MVAGGKETRIEVLNAFLHEHRISAVLESCITAALSEEDDPHKLVDALASKLEDVAAGQTSVNTTQEVNILDAQERMAKASLETVVGVAVSELLADMPAQPLATLALFLRRAKKGADCDPVDSSAAMATQNWSQLVAQGWSNAAAISVGGGTMCSGTAEEKLLARVTKQVESLSSLEQALAQLELRACERRMHSLCGDLRLHSARLKAVPSHYYSLSFEERMSLIGAPSIFHLCKTIVLENTAWDSSTAGVGDDGFPLNAQFYAVIVQYKAKLHADKVLRLVRGWTGAPKSKYNFQLCPEEMSAQLTGYKHNAVAPLGSKTPIPVILSHEIARLEPKFMWLGGGHVDLKLGCAVDEFVAATACRVEDVTYDQ